jgi:voltage-gated potassium channel
VAERSPRPARSILSDDPYAARDPKATAELLRFNRVWRIPIVLAAILPIVLVSRNDDAFVATINVLAWVVFVVDLAVHMRLIPHYLRTPRGKVDLVIVVLTAPWFLIPGLENTAILTLARLGRLFRLVAVGPARVLLRRLGRVFIIAGSVLLVCSIIAYRAEHATNAGFATFGDALWWGIVTLTTVGYGDIVPRTTTGRLAGVMIMVTGIAVLGILAGNLASFFRLEPKTSPDSGDNDTGLDDGTTTAPELNALQAEVARLSALVTRLIETGDNGDHR